MEIEGGIDLSVLMFFGVVFIFYVSVETGGNAALFIGEILQWFDLLSFVLKTQGNAAHFSARALCSCFDFTIFLLRTGGNAAHFSAQSFCSVLIFLFYQQPGKAAMFGFYHFSVKKRGKCCLFSCKFFYSVWWFSKLWEEVLPILLRELLAVVLMFQSFR